MTTKSNKKISKQKSAASGLVKRAMAPVPPSARPFTHDPRVPAVGSIIRKRLRGYDVTHEVKVLDDGFLYAGKHYPSLSAAAVAISGYKTCDGYLFFGLAHRAKNGKINDHTKIAAEYELAVDSFNVLAETEGLKTLPEDLLAVIAKPSPDDANRMAEAATRLRRVAHTIMIAARMVGARAGRAGAPRKAAS